MKYFSKNIAFLRGLKGISQAEIADRLDFKRTTWNGYEVGTSRPYIDGLVKIADYFGVTEADLLHTDLSKKGEYSTTLEIKKKQGKGEYKGEYEGEYSGKKYPKDVQSITAEEGLEPYKNAQQVIEALQGQISALKSALMHAEQRLQASEYQKKNTG